MIDRQTKFIKKDREDEYSWQIRADLPVTGMLLKIGTRIEKFILILIVPAPAAAKTAEIKKQRKMVGKEKSSGSPMYYFSHHPIGGRYRVCLSEGHIVPDRPVRITEKPRRSENFF